MGNIYSATDRYSRKVSGTNTAAMLTARFASMCQRQAAQAQSMAQVSTAVKSVLNGQSGIPITDYVSYRAFGMQVMKLCRRYAGSTLQGEVALAKAKWGARGLNSNVLTIIRDAVFSVATPTPPGP
jgi:hypothetical protein